MGPELQPLAEKVTAAWTAFAPHRQPRRGRHAQMACVHVERNEPQ